MKQNKIVLHRAHVLYLHDPVHLEHLRGTLESEQKKNIL